MDTEFDICDLTCTCTFCMIEAADAAVQNREYTPLQQQLVAAEQERQKIEQCDLAFRPYAKKTDWI